MGAREIIESRHGVPLPGGGSFVYGFDRPLQYYFFQVYDKDREIIDSDELGGCTAQDLLSKVEEYHAQLPEEHMAALHLDLPIP